MSQAVETNLDFDHTVGTEDRFAIRRFIAKITETINRGGRDEIADLLDATATAQGFSEFTLLQPQIIEMFYKKFFGRRHNYVYFPKLKLTSSKFLFNLNGGYEEYQEGILSTTGTIDIALLKKDDAYKIVSIKFYPRMRVVDTL